LRHLGKTNLSDQRHPELSLEPGAQSTESGFGEPPKPTRQRQVLPMVGRPSGRRDGSPRQAQRCPG